LKNVWKSTWIFRFFIRIVDFFSCLGMLILLKWLWARFKYFLGGRDDDVVLIIYMCCVSCRYWF